jgi:hypothetical protein
MNFGYICNIQLFNITTSQMKKRLSIICIYLFLVIVVLGSEVNKVATPGSNPQRKKVGVVLSGGGAKGILWQYSLIFVRRCSNKKSDSF